MNPLADLRAAIETAAASLRDDAPGGAAPTLERPRKPEFGDYSTNAAMLLAPVLGEQPRAIAERLGEQLQGEMPGQLDRVEVAGPGFLNLFLADDWYRAALAQVLAAGEDWGAGGAARAERILLEFVSANPTGPLTAASGRHAAYGDALARVLEFHGHTVDREYYFNDAGTQMRMLGESIRARARGEPLPDGGYEGDYVAELAARMPNAAEASPEELAHEGGGILMEGIRASLERFGVHFDSWFSELALHEGEPDAVERAYADLHEHGHLYEREGALWLRTTDYGDDKDRVLRRSSGENTYFANDIAYHETKRERGYDRFITPLGADHHGYMPRMKAAFAALGDDPDRLEILIMQFVHIVEGGRRAASSKRKGEFVTLDELIEQIGVDAARWFLLQRSHDTTLDLDLDLAREESSENPVYYVQYAHARIASIMRKAGEERVREALAADLTAGHEPDVHPSSLA
ncbi:MAG TPA: arginine--tRNA ligase, partial [Candidatus Limnocylindria bacterium]|nr:arginine--tRNA ligase [Candidatus Limnocylindria bacterium]